MWSHKESISMMMVAIALTDEEKPGLLTNTNDVKHALKEVCYDDHA